MKTTSFKKHFGILAAGAGCLGLLWGCASMGNPSGGPRDEDPPRFVQANPAPGSVNVDPENIYIDFNELVNVKEAFTKVVLSPPSKSTPRVSTRGRRIVVNITDTLLPNTTYTIDFGDAIEDNNESNKLSGFAYTFSTGPVLDSLRISGMVLGAEDMEPQQGVFVGAYTSREDSAFIRIPLERLARTDEYGRFIIRGLRDTTYRLFALKDLDNDKHYANPEEDIAWYEDTIRPSAVREMTTDSIRDPYTGALDTVIQRERTKYMPNNVLLRMYNTGMKPQYLVSYTRPDSTRLEFIFNSPSKKAPSVWIADDEEYSSPLKAERTVGNDTLKFWLPQELAVRDTLHLAMSYPRVDLMTGIETMVNDTVKLTKPKPAAPSKKKSKSKKKTETKEGDEDKEDKDENAEEVKPKTPTFAFETKGPTADLTQPIEITAPVPLQRLDTLAFRLEYRPDTVWMPVKEAYKLERRDTLSERAFKIDYPWQRGANYRLTADSVAAVSIYGAESEKLAFEFKTKGEEELSSLKLTLLGLEPGIPAFAQLLAGGDKPKYTAPVVNGTANFIGIDPGKYYARLYEDFNGDGVYTTGSYRLQRVFGTPTDTLPEPELKNDSIDIQILASDSIVHETSTSDSIPEITSPEISIENGFIKPLSDREIVDSLLNAGYSIMPLETDSVGKDILIAIQPDLVYYFPKIINVKKNWDMEQTWNVFETALDLQKPEKIKKNKPKRTGNRQSREEEEEEEDDDEFGGNPFDPNRRNNNSNNRNNRTNGMQMAR